MVQNVTAALTVEGRTATVRLGGDLDVEAVDQIRQPFDEALAADVDEIVADLTDTEFLDSTALGVLVGAYRRATEKSLGFRAVNLQGQVERLLAMTGTLDLLTGNAIS